MAPARWPEKIEKAFLQGAGAGGFPKKLSPGFQGDDHRVESPHIPGKAIYRSLFFPPEGAEEPVPDDQYPGMVLIQVLQVGAMVYPVMGGGVENKFNRPGQKPDRLCMDPELVDQADGLHRQYDNGVKAY